MLGPTHLDNVINEAFYYLLSMESSPRIFLYLFYLFSSSFYHQNKLLMYLLTQTKERQVWSDENYFIYIFRANKVVSHSTCMIKPVPAYLLRLVRIPPRTAGKTRVAERAAQYSHFPRSLHPMPYDIALVAKFAPSAAKPPTPKTLVSSIVFGRRGGVGGRVGANGVRLVATFCRKWCR